jgi:hypothetical protein
MGSRKRRVVKLARRMQLDDRGRILGTSQQYSTDVCRDLESGRKGWAWEVRRKPWLASVVCEKRPRGPISAYKAVEELKQAWSRRYHPSRRTSGDTVNAQTAWH